MSYYPSQGLQIPVRYRSLTKIETVEEQPVTLLEAKQHLRVDITEDDALIERLIEVATDYAETYCDMTFMMCKYRMKLDAFPYTIRLPRPPANEGLLKIAGGSVEIRYQPSDCDQPLVVLDSSHYRYDCSASPGCIYFACNDGWPADANMNQNAVEIDWWAGFGPSPKDVPAKVKHGILMLIGQYYERRLATEELSSSEVPFGVRSLLDASKWGAYT